MAFTKVTNAGIGSTNTVLLHNLNVVGTVTATDGIFSGIGSFGGNVSVGGVLTYEDVTNVDSVGLITARKGISVLGAGVTIAAGGLNVNAGVSTFGGNVTVGSGITLSPDGNVYATGVVTATSYGAVSGTTGTFSGDITANGNITGDGSTDISGINDVTVSMLSISDTITHTGDTDTKIRFPAADQISFETGATGSGVEYLKLHRYASVNFNEIGANAHLSFADNGTAIRGILIGDGDASSTGGLRLQAGPGSSGMGGGIVLYSHANSTNAGGVYIGKSQDSAGSIQFGNGGVAPVAEYGRFDSAGRLLVASTTSRSIWGANPKLQIETLDGNAALSLIRNQNSTAGPWLALCKSRGTSDGAVTIIQNGDSLGSINWFGADGVDLASTSAEIRAEVDGTPGENDLPGRIVFKTTADGASSPTERLRITAGGAVQLNADTGSAYFSVGAAQDFKWYHDANGPTIMSDTGNQGFKLAIKDLNLTDYSGVTSKINLTSGGFVGINQSAPIKMLHVVENNSASGNIVAKFKGGTGADSETFIAIIDGYSDTANDTEGHVKIGAKRAGSGNTAHIVFHTFYSSTMAERMRLTNTGHLFVGCTASPTSSAPGVGLIDDPNQGQIRISTNASGSAVLQMFFNANGNVGDIRTSGSATQYNTSSDYRLKENAVAISDGITRLKTLKPYRFNFKADSSTVVDGFFAHEVTAVPEAITGTKDEVATADTADELSNISIGDPIYQSIDQSKLVPLLTAALQEEISKREALEARVAALESS